MAKIRVPRNQQLAMAAAHPKPYYSRVVSLVCKAIQAGGGRYAVTAPLGSNLWLLSVRVWLDAKPQDSAQRTEFQVLTGTGPVNQIADMEKWDDVLPLLNEDKEREPWKIVDGRFSQTWTIMRFYEGTHRRFAVVAVRIGADNDNVRISFEISEG